MNLFTDCDSNMVEMLSEKYSNEVAVEYLECLSDVNMWADNATEVAIAEINRVFITHGVELQCIDLIGEYGDGYIWQFKHL
jgi:hypothetical protein